MYLYSTETTVTHEIWIKVFKHGGFVKVAEATNEKAAKSLARDIQNDSGQIIADVMIREVTSKMVKI